MTPELWSTVDDYFCTTLIPFDQALDEALRDSDAAGLPPTMWHPTKASCCTFWSSCNPAYLEWALKLARPGTVIAGDNVVRNSAVADPTSSDPNVLGVRRFFDAMAQHSQRSATAIQTVGSKGYDGFSLAIVTGGTS